MYAALKSQLQGASLIFACGTALFSDGYATGTIGIVYTILICIYGEHTLALHDLGTALSSVMFAGTVVRMLTFGYLSDKVGRKFGMMTASGIMAIFSVISATSSGANGSVVGLLNMLIACRFFIGLGIGAEYPCGIIAASEQSEDKSIAKHVQHRWLVLATNSALDMGFVMASFTPLALLWILGPNHLQAVWRISLGLAAVPAATMFVWRPLIEEPSRYQTDTMKYAQTPYRLIFRRYGARLAAISCIWFLYNFIVYPFGLYGATVVNNITGGSDSLSSILGWDVVINLFYIPGTIGGAFVVDRIGPKNTLILGLLSQAIVGFIMTGLYKQLTNHVAAFAVVYGTFLSFGEFGPGNCIFILGSKSCPTAVRGQFFSVAAVAGKVGAFAGTWVFPSMIDVFGGPDSVRGITGPVWVGSGIAILGAIISFLFIKPLDRDGMAKEDKEFREYLEANGYDTSDLGLGDQADEEKVTEGGRAPTATESCDHLEANSYDVPEPMGLGEHGDGEAAAEMRAPAAKGVSDMGSESQ